MPKRPLYIGALLLIVVVIAVFVFTRGGGDEIAAPATTQPPATTVAPIATLAATTTTAPILAFSSDGVDPVIDELVEGLYRSVAEGTAPPPLPEGLAAHMSAATAPLATISSRTISADLKYGKRVAIARVGDDSVLLADETHGWQIVGADLGSLGLDPWYGPDVRTVLIVGSDARWNQSAEYSRSDSLHIVTAVPAERAGAIVGIPRDSWVRTPSGGNGKITDILANHGPQGIFDTVAAISDAPLEGYILTGFLGFEVISEMFGPFEIDLPARVPKSSGFPSFPAGPQVIEPTDNLLLLARIRKVLPSGDLTRSFNHGVIMQGALREVQRRGIETLPALIQILDDSTFTNFTAGDLLNLGATALLLDPDQVTNVVVPGTVATTSGGASIVRIGGGADAVFADQVDDGLLNDSAG